MHVLCCDILDEDLRGSRNASRAAYGLVVYVRSVCRHSVNVSLWTRKCRAAACKTNYCTKVRIFGLCLAV